MTIILGGIGSVLGMVAGLLISNWWMDYKTNRGAGRDVHRGLISLLVAVILAAVGGGLGVVAGSIGSEPTSQPPPDAISPATTPEGSGIQSELPSSPDPPESLVPRAVPMATSILDLPKVEEDINTDIDLKPLDTTEINGTSYGRVLAHNCNLFCNGSSPQVLEVVLGGKYRTFTATAAVLDTSSGTYRIDVTMDSAPPVTFTTSPGKPTPMHLSVAGVSRLRIQMYSSGQLKSAVQAGADSAVGDNGGGLPGVGLGDPVVLP